MKKDFLVASIVSILLVAIFLSATYIAHRLLSSERMNAKMDYGETLIIHNQVVETLTFADRVIKNTIAKSLLHDKCSRSDFENTWQSSYASLSIEGSPLSTHIYNPRFQSGCVVQIVFGQGKRQDTSSELKDKTLFLYLTNGGVFTVVPERSSLDKKYWFSYFKSVDNNLTGP